MKEIKPGTMGWAGCEVRMGDVINAYRVLVGEKGREGATLETLS
jgi:hypothetical protein